MNKGIIFVLGSVVGGIIGSVGTYYGLKTKFEKIAKDEIESVKASYARKCEKCAKSTSQNASVTHQNAPESILGNGVDEEVTYDDKMAENTNKRSTDYTEYSHILEEEEYEVADEAEYEAPEEDPNQEPYIISPAEYELGWREKLSWNYYADGTITDDMDQPLSKEDLAYLIGDIDVGAHYGEYEAEPDIVFIRNPIRNLEIEIPRLTVPYPETTGEWMED